MCLTLTGKEPCAQVSCRNPSTSLVSDESDDPSADRDLHAHVREDEEGENMHYAKAKNLAILVPVRRSTFLGRPANTREQSYGKKVKLYTT